MFKAEYVQFLPTFILGLMSLSKGLKKIEQKYDLSSVQTVLPLATVLMVTVMSQKAGLNQFNLKSEKPV